MATSPHSNPEVAGSSLARSQCPYGSGFTPRLRLAGWRSARWDHLGGWEDRGISPPPPSFVQLSKQSSFVQIHLHSFESHTLANIIRAKQKSVHLRHSLYCLQIKN
ncbi:hypothetical protein Hanom_Chr12g01153721 [Helianthus anomalus]